MIKLSAEIYVGQNTYEISNNLISVSFSGQDRSDPLLPSWGIKSNSGSIEMYDVDGTIERLSSQGYLANSEIRIYLNIGNRKEQVGGFYIVGASKDRTTEKTKIEFEDVLMSWQQKNLPRYYNFDANLPMTLSMIQGSVAANGNIFLRSADYETDLRLQNIYITHRDLQEGSAWEQLTKICEASSCYIYCNELGQPTIYYGGDT